MHRITAAVSLLVLVVAFAPFVHAGSITPPPGPLEANCRLSDQPAATLLFPYFEVDLDTFFGSTTLIDVVNRDTANPVVAHVVLWTDWGVATGSFDIFLPPGDVVPINVRDLFLTGSSPVTGPGAAVIPDCTDVIDQDFGDPALLQAAHTGQPAAGSCWASPRADTTFATGYITIDAAERCSGIFSGPPLPGYFSGPNRVASPDNVLWGNVYYVDPGGNFAQGQTAVHVVAQEGLIDPGDPTFYGRYVGFDASDARAPLSSEWQARFLTEGAFDSSELMVWRDTGVPDFEPVPCGTTPAWFPLEQRDLDIWDETGGTLSFIGPPISFPLATQRVDVEADLTPPAGFGNGWFELDLDALDDSPRQAWVIWRTQAEGRFSVGQNGIRTNDLCVP